MDVGTPYTQNLEALRESVMSAVLIIPTRSTQ